jgi:rRNA pseudouridine-1189 N-methylase Emg1 (Nep1/Mra1 family)
METKGRLIPMQKLAKELNPEKSVVFVVGAVAKGNPTM